MKTGRSDYLELLKIILTGYKPFPHIEYLPIEKLRKSWKIKLLTPVNHLLKKRNFAITKAKVIDPDKRMNGYDWPYNAYTMIGINRLNNIEQCIREIDLNKVSGDLIEAGVWRGGAVIFMKAVLQTLEVKNRNIYVADSFSGLPAPDVNKYPEDRNFTLHHERILIASREEVINNFRLFNLMDKSIIFVDGLFSETLQKAPINNIALLRIDCDMFGSTWEVLDALYNKLSIGGYVIIDDYNAFKACRSAVDTFRKINKIDELILEIDKEAIYWQKTK